MSKQKTGTTFAGLTPRAERCRGSGRSWTGSVVRGETPKHRTSAFVLDERLAIDAGSLTSGLDLSAQFRLNACLVSHAHLDHIRDLATIADKLAAAGSERRRDVEQALGVTDGERKHNVEVKYTGPDGIMLDVSETGWIR